MFRVPEACRVRTGEFGSTINDGNNGMFKFTLDGSNMEFRAIASDGCGWEHVSVSTAYRTPTWEEMCAIKKMFWDKEDCVIQFHPPESQYINNHSYCLHLWRPTDKKIPLPETYLVGLKGFVDGR